MVYIIYIHLINVDNLLFDRIILMIQQLFLFIRMISFEVKVRNRSFSFPLNYVNSYILCKEKRVQGLELIEEIDTVSQYGTQVHLKCSSEDATIFYTLDGTLPTRHYDNVNVKNLKIE